MIANFFRSLTDHSVEYLLISGQASVLYGAATFSEDIDLWVKPTAENRERLLAALQACGARYYKLTPPLTVENLQRGHGFHFVLPATDEAEIFVDVLGAPPRVPSFDSAARSAQWIDSEWGRLCVIGLKDLIELKKTQRLEDYPVIGKLALAWLDQPQCKREEDDLLWTVSNIFTLPELTAFFRGHPATVELSSGDLPNEVKEFGRELLAAGEVSEGIEERVNTLLQQRIVRLQRTDRQYWRGIIAELKSLHRAGRLMNEGREV